jgi:hypothetical protein
MSLRRRVSIAATIGACVGKLIVLVGTPTVVSISIAALVSASAVEWARHRESVMQLKQRTKNLARRDK